VKIEATLSGKKKSGKEEKKGKGKAKAKHVESKVELEMEVQDETVTEIMQERYLSPLPTPPPESIGELEN